MSRFRAASAAVALTFVAVVVPMPARAPGVARPVPADVAIVGLSGPDTSSLTGRQGVEVNVPASATHLGVRWRGAEEARPQIRIGGRWRTVEESDDLHDRKTATYYSGLLLRRGSSPVAVRFASRGVSWAELVAVSAGSVGAVGRGGFQASGVFADRSAEAAALPQPGVVTRASWGADESARRGPPAFSRAERIVVHHTASANDDPNPAATVRAIAAYHVKARGWDDIGYQFLIDEAGRVYEGRRARAYGDGESPTGEDLDDRPVIGAHVADRNRGSIGVSLIGTFTNRSPTPAALDALERLVAWAMDRHGLAPSAVVGHRDLGTTACPGGRTHEFLPELRRRASARIEAERAGEGAPGGYRVLGRDGSIDGFGAVTPPLTSVLSPLTKPAAALASTPTGAGFWVASADGRVAGFGDAVSFGSAEALVADGGEVAALEPTPSGRGYWVATKSGRIAPFGDAPVVAVAFPHGGRLVGMAVTPTGRGLWVATAAGQVLAGGDAARRGSPLRTESVPAVGIAASGTSGSWLLHADGRIAAVGVRSLGDPRRLGIRGSFTAIESTPSGRGYWVLGADGGVFSFGDAMFRGARSGRSSADPAVALAPA